jgi:hypothetical protein
MLTVLSVQNPFAGQGISKGVAIKTLDEISLIQFP